VPEEAISRMRRAIEHADCPCLGRIVGHHVDLAIPERERHLWSPCLHLEFRAADHGTVVHGLVGPHPNLWTMFAFFYGTLLSAAFFGVMLGIAQLMLHRPPWGMWVTIPVLGAVAGLYWISQLGQRFAEEQTAMLRAFSERALAVAPADAGTSPGPVTA
jgi:hypothetical protein